MIATDKSPGRADKAWGEELAYPDWIRRLLPAVHDGCTAVEKV
jgi:hypothetical protein